MSRPDEGLIHQWLDGEGTPEDSARLEQLVATNPEWAAAVAEARGLMAASSRIVQSLDAVPRAMPQGSVASTRKAVGAPQRIATKPWMRVAAAAVLVVGTAYILREQATDPLVPTATVDVSPPPPPVASAPTAPIVVPRAAPKAPSIVSGAGAGFDAEVRAREEARVEEAARVASARTAVAPSAPPAAVMAPSFLDGCWRVSAPPDLVGDLVRPVLRRQSGDTLVLITASGDIIAIRQGDSLRGGLQAQRASCPSTP